MVSSQMDEVLTYLTAQLYKRQCQQSRRCGNTSPKVEMCVYRQAGLSWFEVVGWLRP